MVRLVRDLLVVMAGTWTFFSVAVRRLFRGPKHPAWSLAFELVAEIIAMTMRLGYRYMSTPLRRLQPRMPLPPTLARRVKIQRGQVAEVDTETITPRGWQEGDPTWLHFHGGGYTMCSPQSHRNLLTRIAVQTGARCIAPNYRKAPENPYPAPIDDCMAVYEATLQEHGGALVLGGDSAGGGLVLAVMQRARAASLRHPNAAVLLSPWVDLTHTKGGSIDDNAPFDYLSGEMLAHGAEEYLQGADPTHPQVSPVFADLSGMPPMLVHSGSAEVLLDQNREFVRLAREAGVQVIHEIEDGMNHVYQFFAPFPQARRAVSSMGKFLASIIGRAPAPEAQGSSAEPAVG